MTTWFSTTTACLLGLAACTFPNRSQEFVCESQADCSAGRACESNFCVVSTDAGAVDGAVCADFVSRDFMACAIPAPGPELVLDQAGTYTYDTDFATFVAPDSSTIHPPDQVMPTARLISVDSLAIAAGTTLRIVGSRPLIIASWSTIAVNGTIDVSSNATKPGAGANPTTCSSHAPIAGKDDGGGGGGGGGGGFSGTGGKGGNGNGQGTSGGVGGATIAAAVAGGCPGANGGKGAQIGGVAGAGGGAVQLTARHSVAITGTLVAGGAGGEGAPETGGNGNGGGGGGGSGGCLGIESPMVSLTATAIVAANGGGGGGGTDHNTPGGRGGDGSASVTPAAGGTAANSGRGGTGSAAATRDGTVGGNDGTFGAGGGGGAAGYVVVISKTSSIDPATVASPAITPVAQ